SSPPIRARTSSWSSPISSLRPDTAPESRSAIRAMSTSLTAAAGAGAEACEVSSSAAETSSERSPSDPRERRNTGTGPMVAPMGHRMHTCRQGWLTLARALTVVAVVVCLVPGAAGAKAKAKATNGYKAVWGPLTFNGAPTFPTYRNLGVRIFQEDLNWADT